MYENFHCHKHYSNLSTHDCVTKPIQYMERAMELGHKCYFSMEHGWMGNIFEAHSLCKQIEKDKGYKLKVIAGAEVYYVDDRYEKDNMNTHLNIICKNTSGLKQLQKILSIACIDGYYYKTRIDRELLLSLDSDDFIITSACTASRLFKTEDYKEKFLIPVMNHFKDNFYLEVQNHNHKLQIDYNMKILELAEKYNLQLIHANDSHYIYPEDSKDRDTYLRAKGIYYDNEEGFILDYPSEEVVRERYALQNVLSEKQVNEALANTLVFQQCEELDINDDIKMPNIYKGEDTKKIFKQVVNKNWNKKKDNFDINRHGEYKKAILEESNVILETEMQDYFIFNEKMVDIAVNKYGGILTPTGRGSGGGFIVNNILGFTQMDRLDSAVPLYASRFMSKARILETKSLPDFDMNLVQQEPFVKASKDLLGEQGVYPMLAYGTFQDSEAFRLVCRAKGIPDSQYNEVGKNLDKYRKDEKWKDIIEYSKRFIGVIHQVSKHPCAYLLMDKDIREEVGIIRVNSKDGTYYCANIDSYYSDKYNYLKNDYLIVTVLDIISKTFDSIGIKMYSLKELEEHLDDKTWEMYEKGLTATLNQVDGDWATGLAMRYKMRSVAEMSNFVAAIRPGFKTLLDDFLDRKHYTTHVEELDNLLEASAHRMLYQENLMAYLIWLGIHEDVTYGIIKKISKKKFEDGELEKLKAELLENWISKGIDEEYFHATWDVIEAASKYSFNSAHSLAYAYDSLYCAYLKSHYPLHYYEVVLNVYKNNMDKMNKICGELDHFGIKIKPIKFRYSNSQYNKDIESNAIYKGMDSIKGFGKKSAIGDELFKLKDNDYGSFAELLKDIKENTTVGDSKIEILIKLDFFSEFGKGKKLLKILEYYNQFANAKVIAKKKIDNDHLYELISSHARETASQFRDLNNKAIMDSLCNSIKDEDFGIIERIDSELQYLGYVQTINPSIKDDFYAVTKLEQKYKNPMLTICQLNSGDTMNVKVKVKTFDEKPFKEGDILKIIEIAQEGRWKRTERGGWKQDKNDLEPILKKYAYVK